MIIGMSKKNNLKYNQNGFASIIIALVLILVLSLLTVGFAQLARREQQTALDKQLANQAYYAAESGINDAILGVQGNPNASPVIAPTITDSTTNVNSDNCLNTPFIANGNNSISSTYGVSYSCVLVNLQPPNIQYDDVGAGSDRYLTFSTDSTIATSDFTIQWGSSNPSHNAFPADTTTKLPPLSTWAGNNYPSVIQVSITPLTDLSRQGLINNTFTAVLYPASNGADTVAYNTYSSSPSPTTEGAIVAGDCNPSGGGGRSSTYPCQVTIQNIPGGTGPFLVHLMNFPYDNSDININGQSAGVPIKFIDGQAVIDSTGKDKNVSKRLLVHIPIHPSYTVPNFSIEGTNVCKRFDTLGGSTTPDSLNGCDFN
jgi:hypothetical protein